MRKPPSNPSRAVAGALLALLAFATAPAAARAGCHLPRDPSPPGAARLDRLAELGALADPPTPPAPSPCDGLRCSGDAGPVPAPGVTTLDRAERWGCLAAALSGDASASRLHLPPPTPLRSSHGGPSPFHPPRD